MNTTRIHSQHSLITPQILWRELPLSGDAQKTIKEGRNTAAQIIQGIDKRLLVIVGPCSVHDTAAALEYADLLKKAAQRFANELYIVMRVYFEKPRTTTGWKGLISDPFLNDSFDMNSGLRIARKLLLDINSLGVPCGTEFLDTMIPCYLSDLIAWSAIGARTSASQIHRQLASGLPMTVGFKNSIDGNIKVAVDAVNVAGHSHHYLSINEMGEPTIIRTMGNEACHIILRGSQQSPNYDEQHVQHATNVLQQNNLIPRLMIDCSHGNSMKNYLLQNKAALSVIDQVKDGSNAICGVMLESNLVAGKQSLASESLVYGQSITDGCLGWDETLVLLEQFALAAAERNRVAVCEKVL